MLLMFIAETWSKAIVGANSKTKTETAFYFSNLYLNIYNFIILNIIYKKNKNNNY